MTQCVDRLSGDFGRDGRVSISAPPLAPLPCRPRLRFSDFALKPLLAANREARAAMESQQIKAPSPPVQLSAAGEHTCPPVHLGGS